MNDDTGDNNGDRGRDDVLISIENATITPSSSDNCVRNNEKYVSASVSVSGFICQEQKCKIVNGLCCNGCDIKYISVTSQQWVQKKTTKIFGWRSRKIMKPISIKNNGRANLAAAAKSKSEKSEI